jgi:uncharacterized protein YdhG (YjbR/CyaY superfamily)
MNQPTSRVQFRDVDTYIGKAPEEVRAKLVQLRKIIKNTVPEAEENISYNMPWYKHYGPLGGFAVYKHHISFFGVLPEEFKKELKGYETSRGTLQLPFNKPIPAALVKKLIKARMKINAEKRK